MKDRFTGLVMIRDLLEFGDSAHRYTSPSEEATGWRERYGRKERGNRSHWLEMGSKEWRVGLGETWRWGGRRASKGRGGARGWNCGEERVWRKNLETDLRVVIWRRGRWEKIRWRVS